MLLVKVAVPDPLFVFVLNAVVGLIFIPQTTPFAEIAAPPSLVMLPPLLALIVPIDEMVFVCTIGSDWLLITKILSAEYVVPEIFVAYDLM